MFDYKEAKDDPSFEYEVVAHFDGEDEAVTAEGYVRGETMDGTDEPTVVERGDLRKLLRHDIPVIREIQLFRD